MYFLGEHCIFLCPSHNPLTPTAIQKLLEIIDRVRLYPSCSFATALDSDINQTTGSGGHLSMWENRCMHAAVCLLRAGQPRSAGDAAKLGQFVGKFSWVTGDPIGVKGLNISRCLYLQSRWSLSVRWRVPAKWSATIGQLTNRFQWKNSGVTWNWRDAQRMVSNKNMRLEFRVMETVWIPLDHHHHHHLFF